MEEFHLSTPQVATLFRDPSGKGKFIETAIWQSWVWFTKMKLHDPYGYVGGLKVTSDGGAPPAPSPGAAPPPPLARGAAPRMRASVPALHLRCSRSVSAKLGSAHARHETDAALGPPRAQSTSSRRPVSRSRTTRAASASRSTTRRGSGCAARARTCRATGRRAARRRRLQAPLGSRLELR